MGKLRGGLMAAATVAAVTMVAGPAQANVYSGYVCQVFYYPSMTSAGNDGAMTVMVNDAPDCGGNIVNWGVYFCTTGAWGPSCTSSFIYTDEKLRTLYEVLMRALDHNIRVNVFTDASCASPTQCGEYVIFKANP